MSYKSLGDFIAATREAGDLKLIHEADLHLDVGCLTELAYEADGPMLLFDRFKGFPDDFKSLPMCSGTVSVAMLSRWVSCGCSSRRVSENAEREATPSADDSPVEVACIDRRHR